MKLTRKQMIELLRVPHPVKKEFVELPGTALAHGQYDGFGKSLCCSVEELAEPFEEPAEDEEPEEDK